MFAGHDRRGEEHQYRRQQHQRRDERGVGEPHGANVEDVSHDIERGVAGEEVQKFGCVRALTVATGALAKTRINE